MAPLDVRPHPPARTRALQAFGSILRVPAVGGLGRGQCFQKGARRADAPPRGCGGLKVLQAGGRASPAVVQGAQAGVLLPTTLRCVDGPLLLHPSPHTMNLAQWQGERHPRGARGAGAGPHPWVPTPLGTFLPRYPAPSVPTSLGTYPKGLGT